MGVRTFTSTGIFDTKSLQFVRINELKKDYARRFVIFYFWLGSSIQCLLSVRIWSYFKVIFVGRRGKYIFP